MGILETVGSVLSLANSAKSLFSGGSDEGASMKKQYAWQAFSARNMPSNQVQGLRAAGLNPMLAVGNGISAPPPITSAPGKDAEISTGRQLAAQQGAIAAASVKNLNSSSDRNEAEADLLRAQKLTEDKKPGHVESQAGLFRSQALLADITGTTVGQQGLTETERTKLVKAEAFLKDFEAKVVQQYGPQKADLIFRQIKAATQISETEATSAKGMEDAYKNIPPELVSTVRLIRSIFNPGNPARYLGH